MQLFPVPAKITTTGAFANVVGKTWILLPPDAGFPLKKRAIEKAADHAGLFPKLRVSSGTPSAGGIMLRMVREKGIKAEGFRLEVAPSAPAELFAADDAGFFYGLQTFLQIIENPLEVPCGVIEDSPSFPTRGYMLDVARNKIPTMETMREMIKTLADLRCNSLQLYMEHTFEYAAHERVWGEFTPFTPEDIMEIDSICREYFIELVPNQNSFGHMSRWLKFDEYKDLAECLDKRNDLEPSKKSLEFVASLYDELLPNFTARKLNIGCDETAEIGKGKSAARCKKLGVTRVYLDFLKKIAAEAEKRGFNVQFWGDIIMHQPELIKELPKNITALEWGYEAKHPFAEDGKHFKDSKIPFMVCPGTSSWCSILGRTDNMIANIQNAVTNGSKYGACGMLLTDWGDGGHHQYYPVSWPGMVMGLGSAWNAKAPQTAELIPLGIAKTFAAKYKDGERLGEFLLEMGRVVNNFAKPNGNTTPYGITLIYYKHYDKNNPFISRLKSAEAKKAIKHIQKLIDTLILHPFEDALINEELMNGLNMALAMNMFLTRALGGDWDKPAYLDLMRKVTHTHEKLWLKRNRQGGLHESSDYIRKAMDYDPDAWKKR